MTAEGLRAQAPRLVFALALIGYGILLVAEEAGVSGAAWAHHWFLPVALAALGGALVLQTGMARLVGGGLLVLSLFSTLDRLGGTRGLDVGDLVGPIILVLVGSVLLRWSLGPHRAAAKPSDAGETVHNLAVMAGHELHSTSTAFRGGSLSACMGGCELDLTGARTAPEGAVIDVFAMWGGIEIRVPRDWTVVSEVLPLMGAFEDGRDPDPESGPGGRLTIRGLAIMGGVEVGN